jgi:hypothetical protein
VSVGLKIDTVMRIVFVIVLVVGTCVGLSLTRVDLC